MGTPFLCFQGYHVFPHVCIPSTWPAGDVTGITSLPANQRLPNRAPRGPGGDVIAMTSLPANQRWDSLINIRCRHRGDLIIAAVHMQVLFDEAWGL